MADRLLVLVPHEHAHALRSILEQARKRGPNATAMRATKHTIELIAHSLCIANGAPAKVARDGWPGKAALLNGQSMATKSELLPSPELTDAHWQLIVGFIDGKHFAFSTATLQNTGVPDEKCYTAIIRACNEACPNLAPRLSHHCRSACNLPDIMWQTIGRQNSVCRIWKLPHPTPDSQEAIGLLPAFRPATSAFRTFPPSLSCKARHITGVTALIW